MKKKKDAPKKCGCGETLSPEDAEFWGECFRCRNALPIQTSQEGDQTNSGSQSDREYHGGMGHRGEW